MGGALDIYGEDECIYGFGRGNLKEKDNLKN